MRTVIGNRAGGSSMNYRIIGDSCMDLTEEQRKAVDWMIKENLRSFCDSVKSRSVDPNTIIARTFRDNGIKVTA